MAAPVAYGLPGPNVRPGAVTAAAAMLFASAGIHAVQLLVTASQIPAMRRRIDAAAADAPEALPALIDQGTGLVGIGIAGTVALGASLAVLGAFVAKWHQLARVATWVMAALLLLCNGCGLAGTGFLAGLLPRETGSGRAYPAWVDGWNTASALLEIVLLALATILLAVPAANDYFRNQQQLWIPPYAGPYPPNS